MFFQNVIDAMMQPGNYQTQLRCFSAPFFQGGGTKKIQELNFGGKILLPNSVLDALIRMNIQYPMLFKLANVNPLFQRSTHAGVLEFLAEEGRAYLPQWMMEQLRLQEGDLCSIQYIQLPGATYAKFKPTSTEFLSISNPRAMLEVELRKFACLTKGDIISVEYNEQVLQFEIMDLKPANAVTIIECDMNVEFDAPDGYVEPVVKREMPEAPTLPVVPPVVTGPFSGAGFRLDGKAAKPRTTSTSSLGALAKATTPARPTPVEELPPVVPDENYRPGSLEFIRYNYKCRSIIEASHKD
jgi:ubiquitin fusion degradation protein 1